MAGSVRGMFKLVGAQEKAEIQEKSAFLPFSVESRRERDGTPAARITVSGNAKVATREPYPGVFVALDGDGMPVCVYVKARRKDD